MQACGLNMQAAAAGVEVGAAMVGVEASWQQVAGYCILKGAGCYNLLVGVDSEMDFCYLSYYWSPLLICTVAQIPSLSAQFHSPTQMQGCQKIGALLCGRFAKRGCLWRLCRSVKAARRHVTRYSILSIGMCRPAGLALRP